MDSIKKRNVKGNFRRKCNRLLLDSLPYDFSKLGKEMPSFCQIIRNSFYVTVSSHDFKESKSFFDLVATINYRSRLH